MASPVEALGALTFTDGSVMAPVWAPLIELCEHMRAHKLPFQALATRRTAHPAVVSLTIVRTNMMEGTIAFKGVRVKDMPDYCGDPAFDASLTDDKDLHLGCGQVITDIDFVELPLVNHWQRLYITRDMWVANALRTMMDDNANGRAAVQWHQRVEDTIPFVPLYVFDK